MSLQLILGSSRSNKSKILYKELINNSLIDEKGKHLVIVPEQFTLQTQKDIVGFHPKKAIMNIDVLSFQRFALRVFEEVGDKTLPILDDTGKNMIIRKILNDNKESLILFNRNIKNPGFINELKSILSEFYQYGINKDHLLDVIKKSKGRPLLRAKLQDINHIYEKFSEYINKKYFTAEEILDVLYKVLNDSIWAKNSTIYFEGFTGFTPIQFKIIEKLLKLNNKIYITLTIDKDEKLYLNEEADKSLYETHLFGMSLKTIKKLKNITDDLSIEFEKIIYGSNSLDDSKALLSLEKNIFRYPYEVFTKHQEDIVINEFKNIKQEVLYMASEIKRLVREKNYRYKDIAIVTGDIKVYLTTITNILTKEGLPFFIDSKKELINNPFVELIRSTLSIVLDNFSYESVFRYLKTGLSDLTRDEVDKFENYIIANGIRGYKKYNEAFTKVHRSVDRINIDIINEIRQKFINEISTAYNKLNTKDMLIKDYILTLYEHGISLDLQEKLKEKSEEFLQEKMLTLSKEYEQIYNLIIALYQQMILLLGNDKVNLNEFINILDAGLEEAKIGVIPPSVDELIIGDIERSRLDEIKAVFFIGVNEGLIPSIKTNDGLLSDLDRDLFAKTNIELSPSTKEEAFISQFYTYLSLTKPKEKLYLSYYNLNDEGKSVRPSYLISKLGLIFEKLEINKDVYNRLDTALSNKGIGYFIENLREYPKKDLSSLWKEIYIYYVNDFELKNRLETILDHKFYRNKKESLSKEVAQILYGQGLETSITRLEKFEACPFAHFINFGLNLEERPEYKLRFPDIGNIFHNAIDKFSKEIDGSGYDWANIPDDVRDNMALDVVIKSVEEYENSFIKSNKRNEYLIERIKRITIRTIWALCNQIRQSSFIPYSYEQDINYKLKDGETYIKGRIDRIDIYEDEKDIYVRVIDYKSGKISFDYERIYYGLQQQLSMYLKAAIEIIKERKPGKQVHAAGVFYYGIDDPIVEKTEEYLDEIYKKLKMQGLVNNDKTVLINMDKKLANEDGDLAASVKSDIIPVSINKDKTISKTSKVASEKEILSLLNFVENKLTNSSKEIQEGNTCISPYKLKKKTACEYCPYSCVCGFDLRLPEYNYRVLDDANVDSIIEEILNYKK